MRGATYVFSHQLTVCSARVNCVPRCSDHGKRMLCSEALWPFYPSIEKLDRPKCILDNPAAKTGRAAILCSEPIEPAAQGLTLAVAFSTARPVVTAAFPKAEINS